MFPAEDIIDAPRDLARVVVKKYSETNVLDAALQRIEYMFTHFDNVCFAVSGGKDSGVTMQLGNMVAAKMHKKFSVMFVDLEVMYEATERYVKALRDITAPNCTNFYWICLPLCEDNATSALNPEFITWEPSVREKWTRQFPEGTITVDNNPFPFYENMMDFNDFVDEFARWLHEKHGARRSATVIGIRTDESLRRFLAIASDTKPRYEGKYWTTEIHPDIYNVYPIYDWRVEDVWGATARLGLEHNHVYDLMYKAGVPLSRQRICQPFGAAQKAGLDQFRVIEPETWERMLERVEGVNFGAIYCRTAMFGNITSMKPAHLTWEQYAMFLLESLGLYEPRIMERYYRKIKYYMLWCEKNEGVPYGRLPEEGNPSWRRIARAIEKNDFYMSHLEFGYDKAGDKLLIELREKHRLTGDGYMQPKILQRLKKIDDMIDSHEQIHEGDHRPDQAGTGQ
jgi:predicted phosphoadenosine phosphosulfate sulfurtransferase